MKTSIKVLMALAIGLILQPSLVADSKQKVIKGKMKKSSPISTRLSYASGCIVGDCDNGYGYYIYNDGTIAIGKWVGAGDWIEGIGVENNMDYFAAGNWVNGVPVFGMTSWFTSDYEHLGSFAWSNDGYWYANGIGLEIYNGVVQYGSFVDAELVQDGCTIYYSSKLRQQSHRILPTDDGLPSGSGSCQGICTNGIGKQTYSDGSFYIGDFANGEASGFGVYVQSDGSVDAGRYVNHYLVKGYVYIGSTNSEFAYNETYDIEKNGETWGVINGEYGEYCSLTSSGTTVPANTASALQQMLASKSYDVDGLFFQYGSGSFDWIYVEKKGAYAAKLAGANASGFFDWQFLHTSSDPGFEYINITNDGKIGVEFGPLHGVQLPGQ